VLSLIFKHFLTLVSLSLFRLSVCVWCVCVRERERDRETYMECVYLFVCICECIFFYFSAFCLVSIHIKLLEEMDVCQGDILSLFGFSFFPTFLSLWLLGLISPKFVYQAKKLSGVQQLAKNLPFNFINIISFTGQNIMDQTTELFTKFVRCLPKKMRQKSISIFVWKKIPSKCWWNRPLLVGGVHKRSCE